MRGPGVGQGVKVGLSTAALVVVGLAAVAQWPTAPDVVDPGTDGEGDLVDQPTTAPRSAQLMAPQAPTMSSSEGAVPTASKDPGVPAPVPTRRARAARQSIRARIRAPSRIQETIQPRARPFADARPLPFAGALARAVPIAVAIGFSERSTRR